MVIFLSTTPLNKDYKRCRYAENPLGTFTEAAFSFYEHRSTSIAATECKLQAYLQNSIFYSAQILAVGSNNNIKTELLSVEQDTWSELDDYPTVWE